MKNKENILNQFKGVKNLFNTTIEEKTDNPYESDFIDKNRPFVKMVCKESEYYYCKALDDNSKKFSVALNNGFYEFEKEKECIEFFKENIQEIL